jgi:serine/threonine protein kinase
MKVGHFQEIIRSRSPKENADFAPPVVRSESVRNIIRERRMLEHVNHPFICNLRYSFQDIEYMYGNP